MARRLSLAVVLLLTACATTPATSPRGTNATVAPASPTAEPAAAPTSAASAAPTTASEPLRWTQLESTGPAAREDGTWTVVGDGTTAILFGGRDGASVYGDLWAFDMAADAWTRLDAPRGPAARFGHDAAWVDGIGLVIFGGQAGAAFFDDLWAFDPTASSWTQLPSNGDAPVARYGSCAAVGPDGRLWISHGFTSDGRRFSDTRAYDFAAEAWSDETPAGARPIERCLHGCWWTDDGALTLYAGQTTGVTALGDRWALRGAVWEEATGTLPPERNLYASARTDGATLVFGGQALDGGFLADLWLLPDGSADAVRLEARGATPPPRAGAELIRDTAGDRYLLFGGRDGDGAVDHLWELRGAMAAGG